jgi:hypothetical protein
MSIPLVAPFHSRDDLLTWLLLAAFFLCGGGTYSHALMPMRLGFTLHTLLHATALTLIDHDCTSLLSRSRRFRVLAIYEFAEVAFFAVFRLFLIQEGQIRLVKFFEEVIPTDRFQRRIASSAREVNSQ